MKQYSLYSVTYSFPTANGSERIDRICHVKRDEANKICDKIDALDGYKLIDLSVEFDGYVFTDED